jgi:hypothetical protein
VSNVYTFGVFGLKMSIDQSDIIARQHLEMAHLNRKLLELQEENKKLRETIQEILEDEQK